METKETKKRYDPNGRTEEIRNDAMINMIAVYKCGYDDGHADGYEEGCADTREVSERRIDQLFPELHKYVQENYVPEDDEQ